MRRIELREYGTALVELPDAALRELMAVAGSALAFRATAEGSTVELKAAGKVGSIITPEVEVLIRPKVPMRNLLYLLEVGGDALDLHDEMAGLDDHDELLPVMATLVVRAVERATAKGLLHSYRQYEESLVALRGRVDMAAQLRSPGINIPVGCRFDEYTADSTENRILKCAVRRVARLAGVPAATRRRAGQVLFRFDEVADVEVDAESVDRLVISRLNRHYEPALRLARLILRWSSLADRFGSTRSSAFLVDMSQVFEEFLEERLRAALAPRHQVMGQYRSRLDAEGNVRIKPDFVIREQGVPWYVADAKYKLTDDGIGRHPDYYQLLAYCTVLGLDEGMLIYADVEGDLPPRLATVRRSGIRLLTYRLPLGGSAREIEAGVAALGLEMTRRERVAQSP